MSVTNDNDTDVAELPDGAQEGEREQDERGLGRLIAEAREARSMSLKDAANELRLEESVVEAIEQEDFSSLGAPVFIKGHLRAYARLLGMGEEKLVVIYEEQFGSEDEWQGVPLKEERVKSSNLAQLGLIALLVIAAVTLAVVFFFGDSEPEVIRGSAMPESPAADTMMPVPGMSVPGDVATEMSAPVENDAPVSVLPMNEVATEEVPSEAPSKVDAAGQAAEAASAVAGTELRFEFSGNCWVEVSDANGRLLVGEQAAGSVRSVSGEAPFSVVIGDVGAASVYVDDELFVVPSAAIRGKLARFEIE